MTMPDKKIFQPKPGQTDYTNARWALGVSCVIKHKNKILVVKRSNDMKFSPGLWNGMGGFLDDQKSFEEKVKEELDEEAPVTREKAHKILKHGHVHGKPLTKDQKHLFGLIASGGEPTKTNKK